MSILFPISAILRFIVLIGLLVAGLVFSRPKSSKGLIATGVAIHLFLLAVSFLVDQFFLETIIDSLGFYAFYAKSMAEQIVSLFASFLLCTGLILMKAPHPTPVSNEPEPQT